MSESDIFGPLINVQDLPRSIEDQIQKWIDFYLAAVERDHGLNPPHYQRPASYMKVNLLEGLPGEDMSPTVIIVTRGGNSKPERRGRVIDLPMDVGIAVVTSSFESDGAREVAGAHGAAISALLMHRRHVDNRMGGSLHVQSWDDVRLDDLSGEESRTRAILRLEFTVLVRGVIELGAGPTTDDPPDDPYQPPGDWPTVLTHQATVSKEEPA